MHRAERFPPAEEFLATLIERQDQWGLAVLQGVLGTKRVKTPGLTRVQRPGQPDPSKPKIETDPRRIAAWFRQMAG